MTNKLKRLPTNATGRDFVVGDLHGCFDELHALLTGVKFDPSSDRLISVGDLVDRGPLNMECVDLVYQPWFHCVRGNHEQMMIDTIIDGNQNAMDTWLYNGGMWSASENRHDLMTAAQRLNELPLIIVVGEGEHRFNVVHAELVHAQQQSSIIHSSVPSVLVTDDMIDNWLFSSFDETDMIWGRSIIGNSKYQSSVQSQDPDQLSITFVGHTPVRKVTRVEQQIYLDTGAVYYHIGKIASEQHALTMACPTNGNIYSYNMMWKTITQFPISDVTKV